MSIQNPLFSVVVLHYKQPNFWKETIQSVLEQDYKNIEIVFSDDGTPGFPIRQVKEYIHTHKTKNIKNVIVRTNNVNEGTASNCDNALALCSGEFILFLDGDDVLASTDTLRKFVLEFEQIPDNSKIVSANCAMCDIHMNIQSIWFTADRITQENIATAEEQYQRLYRDFFPVPSATAFRKTIFDKCGGFRVPYVRLSQDGYFFIHACRLGEHIHIANFIAAKHRAGGVCSPVDAIPSPNVIAVKEEFLKIAEFEIFPYIERFNDKHRNDVCRCYYENYVAFRLASNNQHLGVSEPTYSILKNWAAQCNIPWYIERSKLRFVRDVDIWQPNLVTQPNIAAVADQCCGCGACKSVCPEAAIKLVEDTQGFVYPKIDTTKCVGCNQCSNVCPIITPQKNKAEPLDYLAIKHKTPEIRIHSRSGGVFVALAKHIIEAGGSVYGAALCDDLSVKHIRVCKEQELSRLQGSKYVQSDINDCFNLVKIDLTNNKSVLFSGTPCQIDGILNYLNHKRINCENLLLVDFVCHGVPSPKIYREYCDLLEHTVQAPLADFNFRDKEKGWSAHYESALYAKDNQTQKIVSDQYASLFYQHNIFRPSCYVCPYAQYERVSDITIGDFWGVEKALPQFADNWGISLVMPHTVKGQSILHAVRDQLHIEYTEKKLTEQPNLLSPSKKGSEYDTFWSDYHQFGLQYVINKYVANKPATKRTAINSIGILTFHRAHNFGAMLQAWALLRYLQNCGYDASVINYVSKDIDHSYEFIPWQITPRYQDFKTPDEPMRGIKMFLPFLKKAIIKYPTWWHRRLRFHQFMRNEMGVLGPGLSEAQLHNLKFDAIICGSDQIWVTQEPAYYAAFETSAKKIAYAPSIGNRTFPIDMHKIIYSWVMDFDVLSAREKYLADYMSSIFGIPAPQVTLDPTLLLSAEDYYALLPAHKPNPPYVFCYCVLENDTMVALATEQAHKLGCQLIVERTWLRDDVDDFQVQSANAGPKEFLGLIANAQYVFSNSFHGTVFSILFHKQFYSVYEDGQNSRIDNLLVITNLQERHITNSLPVEGMPIDWQLVDQNLDKAKESSKIFLKDALTN